ncbi:MAG: class I SAM-dependent DNA methyltransferase [Candidatus Paceibacterota bacterium]
MEELYSRLAPVWDATLTVVGFKRGLCRYVIKNVAECGISKPKILDVGCGTGLVSFALLKNFPGSQVVATDLNEDMVKKTEELARRQRIDKGRLTVGKADVLSQDTLTLSDGTKLRLEPASFDIVIASGVLEYTPIDKATPKLLGLLKDNGRLLIISMNENSVGKLWGKMYKFDPIPKDQLEECLVQNGCRSVISSPLTLKEFPANVTRTGHMVTK